MFNLSMDLWECKSLCDSIMVYQEITELFEPGELDHFIPVKLDEIKNGILRNFGGLFKIIDSKNILPDEFKPFIKQKKKAKKNG